MNLQLEMPLFIEQVLNKSRCTHGTATLKGMEDCHVFFGFGESARCWPRVLVRMVPFLQDFVMSFGVKDLLEILLQKNRTVIMFYSLILRYRNSGNHPICLFNYVYRGTYIVTHSHP